MKICPVCQRCYEDADAKCSQDDVALIESRHGSRFITDKYRLDRLLGRGGMGAVYAGTHVDLDRHVAIKLLLPEFTAEPEALERFRREARAAAKLNHQNVADTYDYGLLPSGGAYIIMELVKGQSLREYMNAAGALPFAEAVDIARQTADGVEAAHRSGIVHRDLKPGNIILTRDHQDRLLVKVVDFGVAKLKEQTTTSGGALTASGSLIGTPRYMAPEQCSGHSADARSDIYSLGVILYEMLAGRPPFDAPTATAVAIKHIQEPPPPLRDLRPDVPPELERVVMQSLAKDAALRPQTAADFASEMIEAARELQPSANSIAGRSATFETTQLSFDLQTGAQAGAQTDPHADGLQGATKRTGEPTGEHSFSPATGDDEASSPPATIRGAPVPMLPIVATTEAVAAKVASKAAITVADVESTRDGESPARRPESYSPPVIAQPHEAYASSTQPHATRQPFALLAVVGLAVAIAAGGITLWFVSQRNSADESAANPASTQTAALRATNAPVNANQSAAANNASPANNSQTPVLSGAIDTRSELHSSLAGWVTATNSRDIGKVMNFYAPVLERYYLKSNAAATFVRADKTNLFSHTETVNVRVGEPNLTFSSNGRIVTMRYTKNWNFTGARAATGQAVEELRWLKTDNGWKIVSERDLR